MLRGTITPSGRLYMDGELYLPVFALTLPMNFQVDTGADFTTINPHRLIDAGVARKAIEALPKRRGIGVGGLTRVYETEAVVSFFDDQGSVARYRVLIAVMPLKAPPTIGALLGTDVMRNWRMVCDWPAGNLHFETPNEAPPPRYP